MTFKGYSLKITVKRGDKLSCCTFIGHRDCPQEVEKLLSIVLENLIKENVREFYVGTNGNFDRYVYRVLLQLRKKYDIKVNVVLSYLDSRKNSYYDINETIYPLGLESVPRRFAIKKSNEFMIKNSQYMVCFVNNTYSNAHKFLTYAKNKKLNIINLGSMNYHNINKPD